MADQALGTGMGSHAGQVGIEKRAKVKGGGKFGTIRVAPAIGKGLRVSPSSANRSSRAKIPRQASFQG